MSWISSSIFLPVALSSVTFVTHHLQKKMPPLREGPAKGFQGAYFKPLRLKANIFLLASPCLFYPSIDKALKMVWQS
jgi:hypothetical protein